MAPALAQSGLDIRAGNDTYYYGDHLVFTVRVPDVAGGAATLYIADELGKSSSPISIPIVQSETEFTSPFPFEPQTYPAGSYTLRLAYAGEEAVTGFALADSGRIVIPGWIKDVGRLWSNGAVPDDTFASALAHIMEQESSGDGALIPGWIEGPTQWWADGRLNDGEFAEMIRFLIQTDIIVL